MRIVYTGHSGQAGLGGHAWVDLQYMIGLRALGHDVWYLEDCGETSWTYDWTQGELTDSLDPPARHVARSLGAAGFGGRWIYRTSTESRGTSIEEFRDIAASADLMLMGAIPLRTWRPEYDSIPRRAFIDMDPGFTQIAIANGDAELAQAMSRCQRLFTVGQRIGRSDCAIPTAGLEWVPTLPPVVLDEWPVCSGDPDAFTSVMNWRGMREIEYQGVRYGQKDIEFPPYLDLPSQTPQRFRIAVIGTEPEFFATHRWEALRGEIVSRTADSYRAFIQASRAEFGIAKHAYVRTRSGWFSDRSVCYLASGRPTLLQDTGLAGWLPVGEGVVTFDDPASAIRGVETINADYAAHSRAARALAETFFDAALVLPRLLDMALS